MLLFASLFVYRHASQRFHVGFRDTLTAKIPPPSRRISRRRYAAGRSYADRRICQPRQPSSEVIHSRFSSPLSILMRTKKAECRQQGEE